MKNIKEEKGVDKKEEKRDKVTKNKQIIK
jgi:hypothetical protein